VDLARVLGGKSEILRAEQIEPVTKATAMGSVCRLRKSTNQRSQAFYANESLEDF
jgi:hypothetical protein